MVFSFLDCCQRWLRRFAYMTFPLCVGFLALASLTQAQYTVPGVSGPATGVCGPVAITYGTAGSGSRLQSFISAYPLRAVLGNVLCLPASSADTFTYTLGVQQQDNYLLPSPGLRQIGYAVSPAYGYTNTPAFNLGTAMANGPVAPLPVPAGTYDATIVYSSTQSTCVSQNSTLPAAFLVQAPTATAQSAPSTTTVGSTSFYVTVSVTYTAAALQLPFSDPAGALLGTVTLRSTLSGASFPGSATLVAYGPGIVTYNFYPTQPLPVGSYTVSATYTPGVNYILGSTAGTPTTFLVLMGASATPPVTSTAPPTTSPRPTSTPPGTTKPPPPTTTRPPPTTTKPPPPTTTKPPPTTTKPPPTTTTRPPPTTTKPPPPTTTKPPTTSKAPAPPPCTPIPFFGCIG